MSGDTQRWWSSLAHGGLLIAPTVLTRHFPQPAPPLPQHLAERLRREVVRTLDDHELTPLLDTVLGGVLALDGASGGRWLQGSGVGTGWSHAALTRDIVRPRRVWTCGDVALPVFVPTDPAPRLGVGRGRRAVARVVEWLRQSGRPVALLTNGRQWRLLWAGLEADAFAEWDTSLWFLEGEPGDQVTALRTLLGARSLTPPARGGPPPLLAAISESRRGQAELSDALGEQVREAVETLIRACGPAIDALGTAVAERDVYIAATRVVMRLVVILFAEARDLLPRDLPVYHASYGLEGLRDELDRAGGPTGDRLRHRQGAWGRIVGLFRLIHDGSAHQALPVQRYGGELFAPGDLSASDSVRRAVTAFESLGDPPTDAAVARILALLTRTSTTLRQGRGTRRVEVPIDFSDLSTEYLGILYEGLLDYELRMAPADDPVVFLNLGDQPALPLSRLEDLDDRTLTALVESARGKRRSVDAGDAGGGDDADEAEAALDDDDEGEAVGQEAEPVVELLVADKAEEEVADEGDERAIAGARTTAWARRAVTVARLVAAPRGRGAAAAAAFEAQSADAARALVARVVLPEERYLVRWGGTRKGAGTFYTPPSLAVPTIERTLRPLAYEPPSRDSDSPAEAWVPRTPEAIMALRVCDPAMGSASFLVAALRFLTDALFASLHAHGRIASQGAQTLITLAEGADHDGVLARDLLPLPPDADDFEPRLRARLKRHVVETCIYGVDIDPLAVELARLALWIETMDEQLPFEFLDHRLRCGNSLIGCWVDRVLHYPVLAWDRKAGDEDQATLVHHRKGSWGRTLSAAREEVRSDLVATITGQLRAFAVEDAAEPLRVHDAAVDVITRMADLPIHEADARAHLWRDEVLANTRQARVREMLDTWCALWFWPAADIRSAPRPQFLHSLDAAQREVVHRLRQSLRFFHWEIEFPDVFTCRRRGFDAVVGNPPWETAKPNSKEFFSNVDPLYRAYGKQEALRQQRRMFTDTADVEDRWLTYVAGFKAQSNWVKHVARPFGDGEDGGGRFSLAKGRDNPALHRRWSTQRAGADGLSDPEHPFRHQGSADLNSYKLFLEAGHAMLHAGGRLGLLVPSGIYSDRGTTDLRDLFFDRCGWEWLFAFENRDGIFDIHRSFKFGPVVVEKGGRTEMVRTAFMRRDPQDWAQADTIAMPYVRRQVERFSPYTRAFLEVGDRRDLEVLERIYASSVLLGDDGPDGWGVTYDREFDMTNDSHLFAPRPEWEAKGYRPDEYGRWIGPDGDVALPLYEGRMIGQFDFSEKGWVSGKGRRAVWRQLQWDKKTIEPQYLMRHATMASSSIVRPGPKLAYMPIGSGTNERTMTATYLRDLPAGHSVSFYRPQGEDVALCLRLVGLVNSFVFDWVLRMRLVGLNLSEFIVNEIPIPPHAELASLGAALIDRVASLALAHVSFAVDWARLGALLSDRPWSQCWALTKYERLRCRVVLDASVAALYGLDSSALSWLLRNSDLPREEAVSRGVARTLDPKGFWRVDKNEDPELRYPVLAMVAFTELSQVIARHGGDAPRGVAEFLAMNDGEGWMLPETLRLADYDLGRDDRARLPQPVAERLGPRRLPWQEALTPEEARRECERHARALVGDEGLARLTSTSTHRDDPSIDGRAPLGRPDQRSLFPQPRQEDLFS